LFRKLLIAGAIIGAGLGVAILLGEPAGVKQALSGDGQNVTSDRTSEPLEKPATENPWKSNGVQLTPAANAYPTAAQSAGSSAPPLFDGQVATVAPAATSTLQVPGNSPPFLGTLRESSSPSNQNELPARARLRSEAPRPIGNEPRSPATIRLNPPTELGASPPPAANRDNQLSSDWVAPPALPVGFAVTANQSAAMPPGYHAPVAAVLPQPASPPPWTTSKPIDEPRMHIVVDGDSLERLANRYLDDPRRSREIYELNRELLPNPDLLPIGLELKIPDRSARTSWDREQ
jgi:nucleoid-associated protein YgaU